MGKRGEYSLYKMILHFTKDVTLKSFNCPYISGSYRIFDFVELISPGDHAALCWRGVSWCVWIPTSAWHAHARTLTKAGGTGPGAQVELRSTWMLDSETNHLNSSLCCTTNQPWDRPQGPLLSGLLLEAKGVRLRGLCFLFTPTL